MIKDDEKLNLYIENKKKVVKSNKIYLKYKYYYKKFINIFILNNSFFIIKKKKKLF